jgi:hypothetical protein
MPDSLHARVLKYVKPDQPLGPADAHLIKDREVAALLFDPHNTSFNALLRKDVSVVVGRRGSGKTALLNSYLYRPYFSKGVISAAGEAKLDISDYKVVISILNNKLFDHMQEYVVGPSGARRSIESVIEGWDDLITDYILASLLHECGEEMEAENLSIIRQYMSAPELKKKSDAYRLVWGPNVWEALKGILTGRKEDGSPPSKQEAWRACLAHLSNTKAEAVVIFDSLDEYEIGDLKADRTVGALLRFVAQFNGEHDRIKIKLGFPSEVFPEIQRASANPLKDFVSFDQVRWSSVELARIAAHRYRLFLSLFDERLFSEVSKIDLHHREGVRRFWSRFLPDSQLNRYGHAENSMTYMLRHTQLLPRQLFCILQQAICNSHEKTGGYGLLMSESVSSAISNLEPIIAGEVIQGFKYIYPYAESLAKTLFGSFPTVFSYDQLEDKWRKAGRPFMRKREADFELVNLTEMLLRMGVIGIVQNETERYIETEFAYHKLMPPAVGDKLSFAIHPIFSRYLSCSPNAQRKAVLPQGATLDLQIAP